ncbi:MAG: hypothetical protein [Microvirus sp.]|nr:MAG: hypothetical protein [Microvirus sp.]
MLNRKSANKVSDKKSFTHHASKVHKKNMKARPMRGGFRL